MGRCMRKWSSMRVAGSFGGGVHVGGAVTVISGDIVCGVAELIGMAVMAGIGDSVGATVLVASGVGEAVGVRVGWRSSVGTSVTAALRVTTPLGDDASVTDRAVCVGGL